MKKIISVLLTLVLVVSIFTTTAFGATSGDFTYTILSETEKTCKVTAYNGSAKDVVIPDKLGGYKVTSIEILTFYMNKALSVQLPATVSSLNGQAFNEMNSTVNSITVAEDSPYYTSVDGVLYNKDKTSLVCYPAGKSDETYTVLEGVELIEYYSFTSSLNLKEIILPKSLKTIEDWAFNNCKALTKINLPDGLVSIGASAFRTCRALEEVSVPDSVTFIDVAAFYDCSGMKTITLSNNTETIYGATFSGCSSLKKITIPQSVKTILSQAFYGCDSLTEITIPDSVTVLEDAFHECDGLERVILSGNLTTLESFTFNGCDALKTVVVPNSIVDIEEKVFYNCKDYLIICDDNTAAKTYCINNTVSYILNSEDTQVDLASERIYRCVTGQKVNEIVFGSDDITCSANAVYAGTGVVLNIMKNGTLHSQYTLIVEGDINGDSAVDVLDASVVSLVANNHTTLTDAYFLAGDTNADEEITAEDYTQVINLVLAN